MTHKIVVGLLLMQFIWLCGCASNLDRSEPYSEALSGYLPQSEAAYYGDNDYYHVVDNISIETSDSINRVILNGEVKDNNMGASTGNFDFQQTYTVSSDLMTLENIGDALNESDYDEVVLLKLPLNIGNKWTFKAVRDQKNMNVTAEITDMTDQEITVYYHDGDGYQETRIITLESGVTDFYKVYHYQDASGITGFHKANDYVINSGTEKTEVDEYYEALKSVDMPSDIFQFILDYNLAWVSYVSEGSDVINNYILEGSYAESKIKYVEPSNNNIDFIGFKAVAFNTDNQALLNDQAEIIEGEIYRVDALEAFFNEDGIRTTSEVQYTLVKLNNTIQIIDFESID